MYVTGRNGRETQVIQLGHFQKEADMESYLEKHPDLLQEEDLLILGRQASSDRRDIVDLVAVNSKNQLVIVELKKDKADERVIPQILRYYHWIYQHLEGTERLLDKKKAQSPQYANRIIDRGQDPKIVVVAGEIDPVLVSLSNYVDVDMKFLEMKVHGEGTVDHVQMNLVSPDRERFAPTRTKPESWEECGARTAATEDTIRTGKQLGTIIDETIKSEKWSLAPRFNQGYVPYRLEGNGGAVLEIGFYLARRDSNFCYATFHLGEHGKKYADLRVDEEYPEYWYIDFEGGSDLSQWEPRIRELAKAAYEFNTKFAT